MKRERENTQEIVDAALEKEAQAKSTRKSKKVLFNEVDEVLGASSKPPPDILDPNCASGSNMEALASFAQAERAGKRRQTRAQDEDTEWVADVTKYEEDLQVEHSEGEEEFEPFNLTEEREFGHFQEDGFYVRKQDVLDQDAWLNSEEAKVCSASVQKQHKAMQAQMDACDEVKGLPMASIIEFKKVIVDLLNPGETVPAGLRRLGGRKSHVKQKGSMKEPPHTEGNPEAFNRLTEAADALMSNGDVDVYVAHREDFEQAVSLFTTPGSGSQRDSEDDMFGDTYDEKKPACADHGTNNPEPTDSNSLVETTEMTMDYQPDPQTQPTASTSLSRTPRKEDFSHWPTSELKRFLREQGEAIDTCVEKDDLLEKAVEAASKGISGDTSCPPDGFLYDETSGYYFSSESGMYYDTKSGATYVPTVGKWYNTNWEEIG